MTTNPNPTMPTEIQTTAPNYYKVKASVVREYRGGSPCQPPDVMTYLQTRLRPKMNLRPWVRLRPPMLPCGLYQDEIPFRH